MAFAEHWTLDPQVTFLNHGSFGACPRPVQEAQAQFQARLHHEPVTFYARDLPGLYAEVRRRLGAFLGADPANLAFVPNASTGVNTVLASFPLAPGDEILRTDHGYGACNQAAAHFAARAGAKVVVAELPFPSAGPGEILDRVLAQVTRRTKLALLDHVTSPTALIFPIGALVRALRERGVETLVDGAHAPGMLPLELEALGAAYYTGNCHKWLCAGKGAAFLHVRSDLRPRLRPLVISHGAGLPADAPERFFAEFDWTGTIDPTAVLTIPTAIDFFAGLLPGGWPAVYAELRRLRAAAHQRLADALGFEAPGPPELFGAMAPVVVPGTGRRPGKVPMDGLHFSLFENHHVEVPVFTIPKPGQRILRISTHLYTREPDLDRLIAALTEELRLGG